MVELPAVVSSDGKIEVSKENRYIVARYKGDVTLTIRKGVKQRSAQQNRYYWGVVIPFIVELFQQNGESVDKIDVHEWLKMKFNYRTVQIPFEEEIVRLPQSTSDLKIAEFRELIIRIDSWLQDNFQISLPSNG